ncbi:hypothetical protein ACIHCX_33845 [Streptomyces sp. NPDC052043]|uniref:hypothetical protein n=1 Tax=Streptomyces sp. NPDC052043 TaxID=3365684 RepID=UPI0037D0EC5B
MRGDLLFRSREADAETFGFAEPAFAFGFDDPAVQVVSDLFDSIKLSEVLARIRAVVRLPRSLRGEVCAGDGTTELGGRHATR